MWQCFQETFKGSSCLWLEVQTPFKSLESSIFNIFVAFMATSESSPTINLAVGKSNSRGPHLIFAFATALAAGMPLVIVGQAVVENNFVLLSH